MDEMTETTALAEDHEGEDRIHEIAEDPKPDPRADFRNRLVALQGRALSAKRRLMLDELADVVADMAGLLIEMLG